MKKIAIGLTVLVLILMLSGNVFATIIATYTDRTAFNTDITDTTTIDFEAQNGITYGATTYSSGFTVENVTFTAPNDYLFVAGIGYYSAIDGVDTNYLFDNGNGAITATFAAGVYSLGFDFGISMHSTPSPVTVTLDTGDVFNLTAPLDSLLMWSSPQYHLQTRETGLCWIISLIPTLLIKAICLCLNHRQLYCSVVVWADCCGIGGSSKRGSTVQ